MMAKMALICTALFIILLEIGDSQAGNAYCAITTCACNTCTVNSHTLCQYPNATWATACGSVDLSASVITAADKTNIVNLHNNYRRKVAHGNETRGLPGPQPKASNMRQMVWDEELAKLAQRHVQQCVYKYDTCRDVSRFTVGQSVVQFFGTAPLLSVNWDRAISQWYGEVVSVTSSSVKNYPGFVTPNGTIGQYTQMVWANTFAVGCGLAVYQNGGGYYKYYVCNYGPSGNQKNQPLYLQGTPGSACPTGTANDNGLCKSVNTTSAVSQTATNYCSIKTCPCTSCTSNTNTLCKFTSSSWGAACQISDPANSTISAEDKIQIVNLHNDLRRRIALGNETRGLTGPQPKASNMRQLVWDNELALMAQTHAQQCVYEHDTCRDVSRFKVGQNIAIYTVSNSISINGVPQWMPISTNWTMAVEAWYSEVAYMKSSFVSSYPGGNPPEGVIGHYTQMIWANTYLVGCGLSSYQETGSNGISYRYRFYVCNYGPTGNWVGTPVYSQGIPGSACPSGTVNKNGLCA